MYIRLEHAYEPFSSTDTQESLTSMLINPIQGGGPELTIQGMGAKMPALYISAISQSFQVGLDCYQKQMLNPHNEVP